MLILAIGCRFGSALRSIGSVTAPWHQSEEQVITLCAYAQQGYAFGYVGLCMYVRIYLYIIMPMKKTGCLVPHCRKISC